MPYNAFNSPAKTVQRHSFEFLTAHNIYSHQMIRRAHTQKCCHPVAIHGPLSATLTLILLYFAYFLDSYPFRIDFPLPC